MEPVEGLEIHTEREIAPAVETFATQLSSYLSSIGLPSEDILVPFERRRPVFQNMPTVLETLNDEQRLSAIYISKFAAACAVGLFDAGLNYLWNETVRNLRQKVARFDLTYFFDSVVSEHSRQAKLRTEADLEQLEDWELIRGCRNTGIITDIGFRHLDYIRDVRNHASAAHPNQNELTGLQIVSWLETCIVEVLAKEPDGPVIEVRKLLNSLRTEQLSEADIPHIENALPSMPDELSSSLLKAMIGMYIDPDIDSRVRYNIRLVAKSAWGVAPLEAHEELGVKHATLTVNGEVTRANLAREFIEIVEGQEVLPDPTLASEISTALDNLLVAHNGWHNFYHEPAPARLLHRLVPQSGDVPKSVVTKYVKTLVMCRIGNGLGVCYRAAEYYDDLISRFSDNHIFAFINLVQDSEFASRLRFRECANEFQSLAARLSERAVRPRLQEVLTLIVAYNVARLKNISSDSDFNQLRQALHV